MTLLNLRAVRLRPGEEFRDVLPVTLEPLELAGQRYVPDPEEPDAELQISRTTSGLLFGLRFSVRLDGPCFRCLGDAAITLRIEAAEYQAAKPDSEEERTPYLVADALDLSAWARDAIALALPEKILCRDDCAGLCPGCGADLNAEACTCGPPEPDPRFAKLAELKERLRQ